MISDICKKDIKFKILFCLMTLYIGYGTKNVVVINGALIYYAEQPLSSKCGALW